ncbi:nucleotidyltransferase domain-containing protein [Candidatus Bathyarchaeota archaeon]|nr:MAG: nucleotidyltransferase domain-containing protein [Candidatus Bathyarchaeota archaeon]
MVDVEMERMNQDIRRIVKELVDDLKSWGSVVSIGLFGSWSRGEAVHGSDVDLLVIDSRNLNYEYVERAEINGTILDLNYIPERWVLREYPPEIDQKLYEAEVLYDPNGILKTAKETIMKIMWQPERVDIRTGKYLVEADILLSRGLSAHGRGDYQSAKLNAALGLDAIMKILMEARKVLFSNSRFIRSLEESAESFGLKNFYREYLVVTGLSEVNGRKAEKIYSDLIEMWNAAIGCVEANSQVAKNLHGEVLSSLNFYCKKSFLRGMIARVQSLLQDKIPAEAVHYMARTSVNMLENYAFLLAKAEGTRFDYVTLLKRLKDSKISPDIVYERALKILMLEDISPQEAQSSLKKAREIILEIRKKRKELIAQMLP